MINHSREQNPEKSKQLFKQGMEMRSKLKHEQSMQLFIESLEYDHSNLDAIHQVAGAARGVSQEEKIFILERSIRLHPNEYRFYVQLATQYEIVGEIEKAIGVSLGMLFIILTASMYSIVTTLIITNTVYNVEFIHSATFYAFFLSIIFSTGLVLLSVRIK